jgi:hypothetical protein
MAMSGAQRYIMFFSNTGDGFPRGTVYVTDSDAAYITDSDGAYVKYD